MVTEENVKSLNEQMTNVRLDIRELSTKMDTFKDVKYAADEASVRSSKALNLAQSNASIIQELKGNYTWLSRTVLGAIVTGIIAGAIALLWGTIGGGV